LSFARESWIKVVIISTGDKHRWQLPKGIINIGESALIRHAICSHLKVKRELSNKPK
jgi:hypothetical protein